MTKGRLRQSERKKKERNTNSKEITAFIHCLTNRDTENGLSKTETDNGMQDKEIRTN